MFENATSLKFKPGALDEGLLILRAYIVPILRRQPGLLHLALVPNRHEDRIVILSLWESSASARGIELNQAYRHEIRKLDSILLPTTPPPLPLPLMRIAALPALSLN